jgi:hypothetical protein
MQFIGYVEVETDRAYLFQDHYWDEPDWMPKTQVEVLRNYDTSEVQILATSWICSKKGLREFESREASYENGRA